MSKEIEGPLRGLESRTRITGLDWGGAGVGTPDQLTKASLRGGEFVGGRGACVREAHDIGCGVKARKVSRPFQGSLRIGGLLSQG